MTFEAVKALAPADTNIRPSANWAVGAVGEVYNNDPVVVEEITHENILRLIYFYSDPMGIEQDDTIGTRRKKLRSWLLGYYDASEL